MVTRTKCQKGSVEIIAVIGIFSLMMFFTIIIGYYKFSLTKLKVVSEVEKITLLNYYELWNDKIRKKLITVYEGYGNKSKISVSIKKDLLKIKTTVSIPVAGTKYKVREIYEMESPGRWIR